MNRSELLRLVARLTEDVRIATAALEEATDKARRSRASYMRLWRASKKQGDADEQSRDDSIAK